MKKTLITCLACVMSLFLFAQNEPSVTIEGVIRDSANNPLPNAVIKFKPDTSQANITAFGFSDAAGNYSLLLKAHDSGFIEITAIGYANYIERIITAHTNTIHKDFSLSGTNNFLPPVSVTATPKMVQKGDTTIFNANSYKRDNQQSVEDLLKTMPGFKVSEEGRLSFNGKAINRVLIEDDDLFGESYTPLTQNVTPDKIEKVEVIDNYKDNSDLSQQLSKGTEQVVNLTFSKKIARVFGTIDAGVPLKRYEAKANLISLIPKTKSVTIGNLNSIGKLSTLGSEAGTQPGRQTNENHFESLPAVTVPDIYTPRGLTPSLTYQNHSAFVSNNTQFVFSKKLLMKAIVQAGSNRYSQSEQSTQTYYNLSPPLVITEQNNSHKKDNISHFEWYSRYSPSTKCQLTNTAVLEQNKKTDGTNGFLSGQASAQALRSRTTDFTNEMKATWVLNGRSLVTVTDNLGIENQPQHYTFSPLPGDSLFSLENPFSQLYQNSTGKRFGHDVTISLKRKIGSGMLQVDAGVKTEWQKWNSEMQAIDTSGYQQKVNDTFANNLQYTTNEVYANLIFSSKLSQTVSYTLGVKGEELAMTIDSLYGTGNSNRFFLLPTVSLQKEFTQRSAATFSYNANLNIPGANELYNGYLFTSFLRLEKGSPVLNAKVNHRFNLNYHMIDFFGKGLMLNVGLISQINQLPYLRNLINKQVYSFVQNDYNDSAVANKIFILYSFVQKLLPAIKSQVQLNISGNVSNAYIKQNNLLQSSHLKGMSASFEYRTAWDKNFDFTVGGGYSFNHIKNSFTYRKNRTSQLTLNQTVNYKVCKFLFLNSSLSYLSITGSTNQSNQLLLVDGGATAQIIPKKLSLRVTAKNLANQTHFGSSSINQFYSYVNEFNLLRRYLAVNLKFTF